MISNIAAITTFFLISNQPECTQIKVSDFAHSSYPIVRPACISPYDYRIINKPPFYLISENNNDLIGMSYRTTILFFEPKEKFSQSYLNNLARMGYEVLFGRQK